MFSLKNSLLIVIVWLLQVQFLYLNGQAWQPDNGDGNYKNPVIYADYSDPDIIRVKDDYYMVASSFNCMPGIPVLHSGDLVNWKIIGHVYAKLPFEKYDKPQHGEGSWAPSIRFYDGKFFVYFCTPNEGLFMASTSNPGKKWELIQVADVVNWEDPCPVWDDKGNAYLVHSKLCGGILYVHRMSPDGKKLLDNGKIIFDDQKLQPTIEGPKFLTRDGYFYIFAPAGGVGFGWQTVLRSKDVYGPYEQKVVMHQGNTDINGPHQGGIVDLPSGESWFMHFQDKDAYGRIVHLQPVSWENGWPMIGKDINNDGIGEPVSTFKKPLIPGKYAVEVPQTTDEFDSPLLGLQWQWWANPKDSWYSLSENKGSLRLYAQQLLTEKGNPWFAPNLLLQKFPAPEFTATTCLKFNPELQDDKAGLIIMGEEYSSLCITKSGNEFSISQQTGDSNHCDGLPRFAGEFKTSGDLVFFRVNVKEGAKCSFSYSLDGKDFTPIGYEFTAKKGRWIGAKVGLFCINPNIEKDKAFVDFEWFRME